MIRRSEMASLSAAPEPPEVPPSAEAPSRRGAVEAGLALGGAYHSLAGVPIGGATLAGGFAWAERYAAIAFHAALLGGASAERLPFFQLEVGPLLELLFGRVRVGLQPFLGFLVAGRVSGTAGQVTGVLFGGALSLAVDVLRLARAVVELRATGKLGVAETPNDLWEVGVSLGFRRCWPACR